MLPDKDLFYPVGYGYDGFGLGYYEDGNCWAFIPEDYLETGNKGKGDIRLHGCGDGYGDGYGYGYGDPTESNVYVAEFGFGSEDGLGDGSGTVSSTTRRR